MNPNELPPSSPTDTHWWEDRPRDADLGAGYAQKKLVENLIISSAETAKQVLEADRAEFDTCLFLYYD